MIKKISQQLQHIFSTFTTEDSLLFENKLIPIGKDNFTTIFPNGQDKSIAFVDGGNAEILSAGNFCLSFIRVFAQNFQGLSRIKSLKSEFYLLTIPAWKNQALLYQSKVFSSDATLIDEDDLLVSSQDQTIKTGSERAPLSKVAQMARRFAELKLAQQIDADFTLLDGTLQPTFVNEEKFLNAIGPKVGALAKTSSLLTEQGNNPAILLSNIGPNGTWQYKVNGLTSFVKLHPKAKHIFRYEGNRELLSHLLPHCSDALFLGYPYGLIFADKFARVSQEEQKTLRLQFLLRPENKQLMQYLNATNAHDILDRLEF